MASLLSLLAAGFLLPSLINCQTESPSIVGTWTTKSGKVLTGPGFYDPVNERFTEPDLPGISYSFTSDGYYESALFRAIANPANPSCPSSIIQWQHGTYVGSDNGSVILTPIADDGRQLHSDPCKLKTSLLTHYVQEETFVKFEQIVDPYNRRQRLNLFGWDGTPRNPMWLAYRPPQMLPTETLNPTATATAESRASSTTKAKRSVGGFDEGFTESPGRLPMNLQSVNADVVWYAGTAMFMVGGALYLSTRKRGDA